MITVPLVSQQSFPNNKLGTSQVSIGGYGCALACVSVLGGRIDLVAVNELLVKAGAFVNEQGGLTNASLIYWLKVPNALKNLKFVWRGWAYENDKVRDWIYNKKFPVIVEVNAAPIGSPNDSHFVVYLGDQKLFDPWTGKIRPTSDFPNPIGYVLYEVSKPPPPALNDAQFRAATKDILNSTRVADQQIKDIKAIL